MVLCNERRMGVERTRGRIMRCARCRSRFRLSDRMMSGVARTFDTNTEHSRYGGVDKCSAAVGEGERGVGGAKATPAAVYARRTDSVRYSRLIEQAMRV